MAQSIDDILKYAELAEASYNLDKFYTTQKALFNKSYTVEATSELKWGRTDLSVKNFSLI